MKTYPLLVTTLLLLAPIQAQAEDSVITVKDGNITPQDLPIPANQKVKVVVRNKGTTPFEFESSDLNREKIVQPNSEITLFVGPLKPGTYHYADDYHRDTVKGTISVK